MTAGKTMTTKRTMTTGQDDGKPKDDASKKDDDIGDETSGDNTDTSSSHMTPGPYNLMSGQ